MRLLLLIIGFSFFQDPKLDVTNKSWNLISYTDPFTNEVISLKDNSCNSTVLITMGVKRKLITIIDSKWKFVGRYCVKNQNIIAINPNINEKYYLVREACESSRPSLFVLKVILGRSKEYEIKNDTLRLFYPSKKGSGILLFSLME